MRTKTLILSAVAGALSCASMMGQVYSLNAVGYINVTCPHGYSIIANQLNTGNNVLTNVIQVPGDGSMDGDAIVKFSTASGFQFFHMDSFAGTPPWDEAGVTTATLNPGEGAFFLNVYPNPVTLTFVGTVLQGGLTNSLPPGYNLISSLVPQGGLLTTTLGLTIDAGGSQDGDQIQTFTSQAAGFQVYPIDSFAAGGGNPGYDVPEPSIAVGQGFFYRRVNTGTFNWVRNFTVN